MDYFPRQLTNLRQEKGWSQRQLAAQAGLSNTEVWRLESGAHTPSPATISKLAGALGIAADQLFAGEDQPAPPAAHEPPALPRLRRMFPDLAQLLAELGRRFPHLDQQQLEQGLIQLDQQLPHLSPQQRLELLRSDRIELLASQLPVPKGAIPVPAGSQPAQTAGEAIDLAQLINNSAVSVNSIVLDPQQKQLLLRLLEALFIK